MESKIRQFYVAQTSGWKEFIEYIKRFDDTMHMHRLEGVRTCVRTGKQVMKFSELSSKRHFDISQNVFWRRDFQFFFKKRRAPWRRRRLAF